MRANVVREELLEELAKCTKLFDDEKSQLMHYDTLKVKACLAIIEPLIDVSVTDKEIIDILDTLSRMMHEKPYSPIEDNPEEWELQKQDCEFVRISDSTVGHYRFTNTYQSKHYASLLKIVQSWCLNPSGKVITYKDINRACGIDIHTDEKYQNKLIDDIVDKYYPIVMPYYPNEKQYLVETSTTNIVSLAGYSKLVKVYDIIPPDGSSFVVDKYYALKYDEYGELTYEEISESCYNLFYDISNDSDDPGVTDEEFSDLKRKINDIYGKGH